MMKKEASLLFFLLWGIPVPALRLQGQLLPPKGRVLAMARVRVPDTNATVLATAGHDRGSVRLWRTPLSAERLPVEKADAVFDAHPSGPIFTLSGGEGGGSGADGLLCSGSFDRAATVTRLGADLAAQPLATLPEHTGWVRGVSVIALGGDGNTDDPFFATSIGCNLVNVWTTSGADAGAGGAGGVVEPPLRVARLDGGPSPDDPADEPFRRHDILCTALSQSDNYNRNHNHQPPAWLVAGLVDGSLRAWRCRWPAWRARATLTTTSTTTSTTRTPDITTTSSSAAASTPFDATGGCGGGADFDERPAASLGRAHEGRVTGCHWCPDNRSNNNDEEGGSFLTVGRDGHWWRWRLEGSEEDDEGGTGAFRKVGGGSVQGCISASTLVPPPESEEETCWSLVMGTTAGVVYTQPLSPDPPPESEVVWAASDGAAVTALCWVPWSSRSRSSSKSKSGGGEKEVAIAVATSDGLLRVFADE